MIAHKAGLMAAGVALLALTGITAEPVSGPFQPEEILVHPDQNGICLRYKSGTRSSKRTVEAGNSKVFVDTGIAGFGVEAYLSMTDGVVVVDSATQKTLWFKFVGAFYTALSFVQAKDKASGEDKVLLWIGGGGDLARLFEIRSGTENYLSKQGDALIASPETNARLRGAPVQATQVISGGNSKIKEPRCVRVTSPADWATLWAAHSPSNTPPPRVDFEKEMVVGVFQGQYVNCRGITPLHILDCQDTLEVFVAGKYYQSYRVSDPATPYGLFIVPKSAKRLLVKDNIQGYIAAPPIWKEIAEFEALPR